MKRYKPIEEKTINQLHKEIDILYNKHKNHFSKISDLVNYLSKTLDTDKYTVLQILELIEKKK